MTAGSMDRPAGEVPSDDLAVQARLREAADDLRAHVDERWVEVANVVLSRALTATRPSPPVRAQAPTGPVEIAEQVLVSYLRDSIDQLDDCEVVTIGIDTRPEHGIDGRGEVCTGVLVALAVRYQTVLIPLADRVREVAVSRLAQMLGPVEPAVSVSVVHVHIADVTRGDPKLTTDERSR